MLEYVSPLALPVVDTTDEVSEESQIGKPTETLVSISQVDETGLFEIRFSDDVLWPDDTLSWTSSNEGADYFDILFFASDETLDLLEHEELEVKVSWHIV